MITSQDNYVVAPHIAPIDTGLRGKLPNGAEAPSWVPQGLIGPFQMGVFARDLLKEATQARQSRDEFIRSLQSALHMEAPDRQSPLGEDGANIRVPLTREMLDTVAAFVYHTITSARPFFRGEAPNSEGVQAAGRVESYWDHFYASPEVDFRAITDKLARLSLAHGTAFLCVSWKRKIEKVRLQSVLSPNNLAQLGFSAGNLPLESLGVGSRVSGPGGVSARLGQVVDAETDSVIFDRPDLRVVSYFDFICYPARCQDVDDAILVGERVRMSIGDVKAAAASGVFSKEAVDAVLKEGAAKTIGGLSRSFLFDDDPEKDVQADGDGVDEEASITAGDPSVPRGTGSKKPESPFARDARELELFEGVWRADATGSGDMQRWYVTIEASTGMPLRFQRFNMRPGSCNYIPAVPYPKEDSLYGFPIAQILEGTQDEADAAVNIALDAAALAMTILVLKRATGRNFGLRDIQVGINERVVVDEDDYQVRRLGEGLNADILPQIDVVRRIAQQATAASEAMAGVQSGGEQTATEVNQVLSGAVRRLSMLVARYWSALVKAHGVLHHIGSTHHAVSSMDPGAKTRIFVRYPHGVAWSEATVADWMTPIDFVGHGDALNTNEALKLQGAEKLLIAAAQNPLMQGSAQKMYRAMEHFLSAYGIKDPVRWIGTMDEARQKDEQSGPSMPTLPPNVNDKYLAAYIQENPDLAEPLIEALTRVSEALGAGKESQDSADSEALDMQKQKALFEIEKEGMGVDMQREKAAHEIGMASLRQRQEAERQRAGIGEMLHKDSLSRQQDQMQVESKLAQTKAEGAKQKREAMLQRASRPRKG